MRTYNAIEKVSKQIINDDICEAIILKGSIGRGDDDAYSDVDMYVIVKENRMQEFLERRVEYLSTYQPIIFYEYQNFVADQVVAIFEDGLHFDLYTVTMKTLPQKDKIKIIYDPKQLLINYKAGVITITNEDLANSFHDILYTFVEADSAFLRKNYVWTSSMLRTSLSDCALLLRYIFDKDYAYLRLKKINEVIPEEQYMWLEEASSNLNQQGYQRAVQLIIQILDYVVKQLSTEDKSGFNFVFFQWIKRQLGNTLFTRN